jgi:hypothetical protein
MYSIEIYFGRLINSTGGTVTDIQWADFVRDYIVPRFPSFTIISGMGCWRGNMEQTEICRVLVDWADLKEADNLASEIAKIYCREFCQDCVLVEINQGHQVYTISAT